MKYFLLFVLIFLAGCSGTSTIKSDVGGVDIFLVEGKPPFDGIYEERPFAVEAILKNYLDRDVNGEICTYDSLGDEFGGIERVDCKGFTMDPAIYLEGELIDVAEQRYSFGPYIYTKLPLGLEDTNINVDVTYLTQSRISAPVCLKKDPSFKTDFPCDSDTILKGEDMRRDFAPVTVKEISTKMLPEANAKNTMVLDLTLEKEKRGFVVKDLNNNEPLLGVDVKFAGTPGTFSCIGLRDGFVKMTNENVKLRCSGDLTLSDTAYVDALDITLNFGYKLVAPDPAQAIKIYRLDDIGGK